MIKELSPILVIGLVTFTGFILGQIAKQFKLPKITGFLLAGILFNPQVVNIVPKSFISHSNLITNLALSFITFSVGGSLLYSRIKKLGKAITYITIFEAEVAYLMVAVGLFFLLPIFLRSSHANALHLILPITILMAALASPTDPSATLAVAHEYKAKGEVSSTIMGVAAFDDAIGIINFSFSVAIATVLISANKIDFIHLTGHILYVIFGGIAIGVIFGFIFNYLNLFLMKDREGVLLVLILSLLTLTFGIARIIDVDELLATMSMGAIVVNFNPQKAKILKILERYQEELIFLVFFVLSGMQLDFSVLKDFYIIVILFVIFRATGKFLGTYIGANISKASDKIKRFTAGGLLPQGGIVIGLALTLKQVPQYSHIADLIISVVIGATIFHELLGPIAAKWTLTKAGEIK